MNTQHEVGQVTSLSHDELLRIVAENERLKRENASLASNQKRQRRNVECKVAEKSGCVSLYHLSGRFPVNLYPSAAARLLIDESRGVLEFILHRTVNAERSGEQPPTYRDDTDKAETVEKIRQYFRVLDEFADWLATKPEASEGSSGSIENAPQTA